MPHPIAALPSAPASSVLREHPPRAACFVLRTLCRAQQTVASCKGISAVGGLLGMLMLHQLDAATASVASHQPLTTAPQRAFGRCINLYWPSAVQC